MILLDTNILVYAHNSSSELYEKAKEIRENSIAGKLKSVVSQQNLLEFYSVTTNPRKFKTPLTPIEAINIIKEYQFGGSLKFILPNIETSLTFIFLFSKYKKYIKRGTHVYDVYLAATALSNGIEEIYTANDKDFMFIDELKVTNPFS
ncbi:hypothetical protein COW99_03725 [Candidatus Roizmanbacteria bacterium CG22_combo_CG10-13_8_21_14_all_38_20]|uniref:PIN domain-containing protein n=1 Tax=Candidatus Roizmanbacteria bacterium CG22_combo_CG10-13_8_21_14_all_38_20 TaxID=1974862 RepID=A0A2H0BV47_9BACT|nr:type II toxin-antitoxin system VapC family toxin [Candidatus Microgenomates bacterium]PIP61501.1 MAG: hypothetical protein COW99_03725 [Candidatus Roizmanbacteria bacterium CG22_combo_CG10-13_8_21_14_all_38_20]PJC32267.1 MAG: hypothetical protein CO050_00400 [Candidatus Roizmanbacteria bacterium CG_4_9_14_0_2_um_filter_38_17]